jgi:glycosyltransferase involved in cell wall biosynthesis
VNTTVAERFSRVAVIHEWLTIPGGSEKVVCAILGLLPQAELFTTVYDPAPWPPAITDRVVHTSVLDRIPGATRNYRYLLPLMDAALRRVDRRRSEGPDVFVANSAFVASRIREAYGRDSRVIHPPVDVARLLAVEHDPSDAYVVFGRLVPYKRADIAIEACRRLGRRLIVAGSGRDLERLRGMASGSAQFIGDVPDDQVAQLFARARALLFPGLEDFGMVPVEAQAAGVPVIAYGAGGVLDSVIDGRTGVLYENGSVDALCEAILKFESLSLDDRDLRANAARFAPERFAEAFAGLLCELTAAGGPADNLAGP